MFGVEQLITYRFKSNQLIFEINDTNKFDKKIFYKL